VYKKKEDNFPTHLLAWNIVSSQAR